VFTNLYFIRTNNGYTHHVFYTKKEHILECYNEIKPNYKYPRVTYIFGYVHNIENIENIDKAQKISTVNLEKLDLPLASYSYKEIADVMSYLYDGSQIKKMYTHSFCYGIDW
jgi:thermostable 8-oxoguanine DNA glycosylase